jgi:hypothetical protein
METQTETNTKGEMAVMGKEGDTKIIWDQNNNDEVENAKATFDRLKGKGYLAFKVIGKEGDKGEQMNDFDPKVERIIFAPRLQGG